jgi:hypothetical protein
MTPEKIRLKCVKLAADITMSEDPFVICSYAAELVAYVRHGEFPSRRNEIEDDEDDQLDDEDDDRDFAIGAEFLKKES